MMDNKETDNLPRIEAVRKHEAHGGMWIATWRDSDMPVSLPMFIILKVAVGEDGEQEIQAINGWAGQRPIRKFWWSSKVNYEPCDKFGNRMSLVRMI